MSYLSQLKAKIAEIGPPGELPKLPEPGFVSFDSAPNSPIPEVPLALPQPSSGVARLWLERIRALNTDIAPASVALSRWTQLLADAQRLLVMWGDQAVGLGWGEVDLFAVPPGPERWGRGGLAMALSGRPVIAMTAEAATIENPHGPVTRYYRRDKPRAVLLWSARAFDERAGS